jgi:hypothetical protein
MFIAFQNRTRRITLGTLVFRQKGKNKLEESHWLAGTSYRLSLRLPLDKWLKDRERKSIE